MLRARCSKNLLAIFDAADPFTGNAPQHDDMTLPMIKAD
jgi:hypothetical protein